MAGYNGYSMSNNAVVIKFVGLTIYSSETSLLITKKGAFVPIDENLGLVENLENLGLDKKEIELVNRYYELAIKNHIETREPVRITTSYTIK